MKKLLIILLLFITPYCLKAQDTTLGKTKEEIRAMIKSNSGIKLSKGNEADTLSLQGGLQAIMYYKNNICYSSKSVMPLVYKDMVIKKMTDDSYKKIKENVWTNAAGTIQVELTVIEKRNIFTVQTSQVINSIKN